MFMLMMALYTYTIFDLGIRVGLNSLPLFTRWFVALILPAYIGFALYFFGRATSKRKMLIALVLISLPFIYLGGLLIVSFVMPF